MTELSARSAGCSEAEESTETSNEPAGSGRRLRLRKLSPEVTEGLAAHSQQIGERRYVSSQLGRNDCGEATSRPTTSCMSGDGVFLSVNTVDNGSGHCPASSKKEPRELALSRPFIEEGLRFSPVSGEKLRIVLTWLFLKVISY